MSEFVVSFGASDDADVWSPGLGAGWANYPSQRLAFVGGEPRSVNWRRAKRLERKGGDVRILWRIADAFLDPRTPAYGVAP